MNGLYLGKIAVILNPFRRSVAVKERVITQNGLVIDFREIMKTASLKRRNGE